MDKLSVIESRMKLLFLMDIIVGSRDLRLIFQCKFGSPLPRIHSDLALIW